MKRCLNPVFNESFPFDVPAHVLRETTIIITVMDKDRLSRNDVIGKVSPSLFFSSSSSSSSFFFFWPCDRPSASGRWASLYWPLLEHTSSALYMNKQKWEELKTLHFEIEQLHFFRLHQWLITTFFKKMMHGLVCSAPPHPHPPPPLLYAFLVFILWTSYYFLFVCFTFQ